MAKKVQRITKVGTPTNLYCMEQRILSDAGRDNWDDTFGASDMFKNLAAEPGSQPPQTNPSEVPNDTER